MCRALLYLGEPVLLDNFLYQPDSALVRQSYMPKMLNMLNLAGFGLRAWDPSSHQPDRAFSYYSQQLPVFGRKDDGFYLRMIEEWSKTTETGDRAEIEDLPDDLPL